jgi:integrase
MEVKKNDILQDFEEVLRVDYTLDDKTAEDYVRVANKYIEFHDELIPQPAQEKARKWKKYWLDKNYSGSHKNNQLRGVEKYYNFHDIDFSYKKKFETEDSDPPVLKEGQYKDILYRGAKDKRDTAMVYVLAHSGIRESELSRVDWGDISWKDRKFENIPLKGGDKDNYRFSKTARDSLEEYRKTRHNTGPNDPLFTSKTDPESRLTRHGIYQAIIRMSERAGLDTNDDNVCPHGFRGYFITKMAEEGKNLEKIAQMVNHDSIRMTAKYVGETDEEKEKEIHSAVFD